MDRQVLRYREPFPPGPVSEGLIIDDYVCLRIHSRDEPPSSESPDAVLMRSASEAYRNAKLEEAEEKHVSQASSLTVWGTSLDSTSGRVGAPLGRCRVLSRIALHLASHRIVTPGLADRLVALFIHPIHAPS